ncbi:MAG: hypothetical protein ICV77_05545 [Cyanobacteria bacterium Co-bin8]|nr:hypothetical protein [Cyanobacteria bacterium Co-bin8]
MNSNDFKQIQLNFSGAGCWLTVIAAAWLLGAVGLGWLVKSVLVLVLLLALAPVLAFVGLRWWLKRNLVQGKCPTCSLDLTGLKNTGTLCPNCGTAVEAKDGIFQRSTPEGTIDVAAVEVPVVEVLPERLNGADD